MLDYSRKCLWRSENADQLLLVTLPVEMAMALALLLYAIKTAVSHLVATQGFGCFV